MVFDTWPLIEFFEGHEAATDVEQILQENHKENQQMFISTVNAGEVWYTVARAHSKEDADQVLEEIKNLKINIEQISWELTKIAANYKYGGGISYADCFAAALAKARNAPLVTGDPEFKRLEKEIEIIWV